MTTAIVTDSTTSLMPGMLDRPDVRIVPLTFHFGAEESYLDKVELSNAEFYERLRDSDEFPTTSQPPAGAFVEVYEDLDAYDDILVLTVSSKLSGTYESATTAAGMVERPVEVVDMMNAEIGSGLILREAIRVIDDGGEFRDAKRAAEAASKKTDIYFAVGTLEYLAKSGRIGRAQKLFGTALDIKPVLTLDDGEVVPYKRVRGKKRQMNTIVEELKPAAEAGKTLYFGHVDTPESVSELAERLGVEEELVSEIGGVVGCHIGPGTYGVACL
jgi:DegV family protein with EDD domain